MSKAFSNHMSTLFYGSVINPTSLTSFTAFPRCLLAVDKTGTIAWVEEDVDSSLLQEKLMLRGLTETDVDMVVLREGEFLIPGFVDTHTHAPQVPNLGSGQQYELLDWLNNVTFPEEAKFSDLEFATRTYERVVRTIINCGTTTCCYYGTLHLEATKRLADIVHNLGQRAFIGKCNMDRNSPPYYVEASAEQSVKDTKALIRHIDSLGSPLVSPIITPRFAISCTPPLLEQLGKLATSKPEVPIQTHISENRDEVEFTKELFACSSYAEVYEKFNLLRHNTILAHGIWLEDVDIEIIKRHNVGLSHCPTSNFNLTSGVAPVGRWLDLGLKVGLGTDVSGGFSPSILNTIQHASIAAKVVSLQATASKPSDGKFANSKLSIATLFYLATLGGAEVCCLEKQIGSFAAGKRFDALLVDVRKSAGNPSIWTTESSKESRAGLEDMLERFMFCGDDRNISKVFVQGRCIGGTSHRSQ